MNTAPTPTELELRWLELTKQVVGNRYGRIVRRVLPSISVECFVAVDSPGLRRILTVGIPPEAKVSEPIAVTAGVLAEPRVSTGGEAALDVVLQLPEYSDIFTALVADLLSRLERDSGSEPPHDLLLRRLAEWQRLLAHTRPEGLTREQQQGLFGELYVLADLVSAIGANAINSWSGPAKRLQDFQFDHASIEVKTAGGAEANIIRITSERQLDHDGARVLHLVALGVEKRSGGHGVTLPEQVACARTRAREAGALSRFEETLLSAGYLGTQEHLYQDRRYLVRSRSVHRVDIGFPRITPHDLPTGISQVSYSVDLLAAARFTCTFADLLEAVRGNK